MNAYEVLKERGFIEQLTHEEEIKALFEKGGVTFYFYQSVFKQFRA